MNDGLGQVPERWYCVSRDGLATWCQDAVDAADQVEESTSLWPRHSPYVAVLLGDVAAERERCAQEIDRLRSDRDLEKKWRKDAEHDREELIAAAVAAERNRIVNALPGGYSVDPQWVADMVRDGPACGKPDTSEPAW